MGLSVTSRGASLPDLWAERSQIVYTSVYLALVLYRGIPKKSSIKMSTKSSGLPFREPRVSPPTAVGGDGSGGASLRFF